MIERSFQILVPQPNLPLVREILCCVRRSKRGLFRYLTQVGGFHNVGQGEFYLNSGLIMQTQGA
jgi:hypothetical protein